MSRLHPHPIVTANDKAEILALIHSRQTPANDENVIQVQSRDLTIWVGADSACSRGLVRLSDGKAEGRTPEQFWVRENMSFDRHAERWRIIDEQRSAPVYIEESLSPDSRDGTRLRLHWISGDTAPQPWEEPVAQPYSPPDALA